ncbi:uncharacterized protein [Procambarus clarkii]|uniref:uncharacterized protein n=1 Tax=Procambarus clarkii TaxID=6728 RepID=UPI0037438038
MKACVAALCGVLAAVVAAQAQGAEDVGHPSPAETEERLEVDRRQERLFAIYTTTSVKRLATTTITALSTCLSTTASPACQGRKKRTVFKNLLLLENDRKDPFGELAGSQLEPGEVEERVKREVVNRDGKKLTIWSTYLSTLTLTSTSYLTGTTVTVTAMCAAPGITQGCFGK